MLLPHKPSKNTVGEDGLHIAYDPEENGGLVTVDPFVYLWPSENRRPSETIEYANRYAEKLAERLREKGVTPTIERAHSQSTSRSNVVIKLRLVSPDKNPNKTEFFKSVKAAHEQVIPSLGEPPVHGPEGKSMGQEPKGFVARHGEKPGGEFSRGF